MPTTATDDLTQAGANFIRLVFSTLFPAIFITACGVSGVLLLMFRIPQFGLLWVLAWNGLG
ncbi:MAG TPA: hypothetical protein VHX61_05395 [Rhizomicrobium sp.]|jgi:hypothetical protein|nr:hypothetical protein [Rhizomicrobium sp.]